MRTWAILAAVVLVAVASAAAYDARARAVPSAQDCDDWANGTWDRVDVARQLLYPPERQEESTGSLAGDAQALVDLAEEQAGTEPPDEALNLNGDLVEAFAAGAAALGGAGGASPDAQIAFAKAIVYNADLRLSILLEGC